MLHHTYHLLVKKGSITCGCEPPLSMCRDVGRPFIFEGVSIFMLKLLQLISLTNLLRRITFKPILRKILWQIELNDDNILKYLYLWIFQIFIIQIPVFVFRTYEGSIFRKMPSMYACLHHQHIVFAFTPT